MKVTGSFPFHHLVFSLSSTVDDANGVPIGLRSVRHEACKVRVKHAIADGDGVQVLPEQHLSRSVFTLEFAASNGEDAPEFGVVDVAGLSGPLGDTLDMVKHHPTLLEVSTRLHTTNKINSTSPAHLRHF